MGVKDIIVTPFVLLLIFIIGYIFRLRFRKDSPEYKYFVPGLWLKIAGSLAFCFIYQFYYKMGGDTFAFFNGTRIFWKVLQYDLFILMKMFTSSSAGYPYEAYYYVPQNWHWVTTEPQSFFLVKIASVIGFFTFDAYSSISLVFAFLCFTGVFALYRTLVDIYPVLYKQFAVAVFFIPSVIFWGSGLMKDTITLGSAGWLIYSVYHLFIRRSNIGLSILMLFVSSYLIMNIKAYIFLSMLPALLFWVFVHFRSRINNPVVRFSLGPMIVLIAIVINYLVVLRLGAEFTTFSPDEILGTANKYQTWHTFVSEDQQGSGYTLGDYDPTWSGALKTFPAAVNVALFRPYLWEVKNSVMLLSGIESTAIFLYFLFVLLKTGFGRFVRIIYSNPLVLFCFFFTIFFAFAIGFSAYNFGALVRYKIPCIPLFIAGLMIIYHEGKRMKAEKMAVARF